MKKELGRRLIFAVALVEAACLIILSVFFVRLSSRGATNSDYKAAYDDLRQQYNDLVVLKYDTATTTIELRDSETALRTCQSHLEGCKYDLRQATTTTTRQYVLDSGVTLVEQWNSNQERDHLFWLLPKSAHLDDGPGPKSIIGSFPAVPSPDGNNPVTIERLNSGLYRLAVTADYTEAGETHIVWIDPAKLNFVTLGQNPSSD